MAHNEWYGQGGLRRTASSAAVLVLGMAALAGCGSDRAGFTSLRSGSELLTTVRLDQHAYNLSTSTPFQTARLHATALLGDSSVAPGKIAFTVRDTSVTVDSSGLLTARYTTTVPVVVYASLTYEGVTRRDSALVYVSNQLGSIAGVTIVPQAGDSAHAAPVYPDIQSSSNVVKFLVVGAVDGTGAVVPSAVFSVRSSDTTIATLNSSGLLTGRLPGRVWLYISTFVNGVTMTDSLAYTIGTPLFGAVSLDVRLLEGETTPRVQFQPSEIVIAAGGDIRWQNFTAIPVDIVFDDPSAARESVRIASGTFDNFGGSGNVPKLGFVPEEALFGHVARLFTHPGRYPYHSMVAKGSGVVVVQ